MLALEWNNWDAVAVIIASIGLILTSCQLFFGSRVALKQIRVNQAEAGNKLISELFTKASGQLLYVIDGVANDLRIREDLKIPCSRTAVIEALTNSSDSQQTQVIHGCLDTLLHYFTLLDRSIELNHTTFADVEFSLEYYIKILASADYRGGLLQYAKKHFPHPERIIHFLDRFQVWRNP